MKIKWVEREPGFHVGTVNGDFKCKISEHWSGCWLDGLGIPRVCANVEAAKAAAQQIVAED